MRDDKRTILVESEVKAILWFTCGCWKIWAITVNKFDRGLPFCVQWNAEIRTYKINVKISSKQVARKINK